MTTTEYEGRTVACMVAGRVDRRRPRVEEAERGQEGGNLKGERE